QETDNFTWGVIPVSGGEDSKTIGTGGGSEVSGPGPLERLDPDPPGRSAATRDDPRRMIPRPITAMMDGANQTRSGRVHGRLRLAGQSSQGRPDEQEESHQAADRIARQAKDQCPAALAARGADPEPERFSRLEAHLVEDAPHAQLFEGPW